MILRGHGAKAAAIMTLALAIVAFLLTRALAAVDEPTLTVSPTSGLAGAGVSASGSGFAERASIDVCWDPGCTPLGEVTSNPTGRFGTTVSVPDPMSPGAYLVTACEQDRDVCASATFTVLGLTTTTFATTTTIPSVSTTTTTTATTATTVPPSTTVVPTSTTLQPIPGTTVAVSVTTPGQSEAGNPVAEPDPGPPGSTGPAGSGDAGASTPAPGPFEPTSSTTPQRSRLDVGGSDVLSLTLPPQYVVPDLQSEAAPEESGPERPGRERAGPEAARAQHRDGDDAPGITRTEGVLLWFGSMLIFLVVVYAIDVYRARTRASRR